MLRKFGRLFFRFLDQIEVIVLVAMICYIIGAVLILYYGL